MMDSRPIYIVVVTRKEIQRRKRRAWITRHMPGILMKVISLVAAIAAMLLLVSAACLDSPDYLPFVKAALASICVLGLCGAAYETLKEI